VKLEINMQFRRLRLQYVELSAPSPSVDAARLALEAWRDGNVDLLHAPKPDVHHKEIK